MTATTRTELIEAIAAQRWCPSCPQPCAHWQALKPRDKQECMDEVRQSWSLIVDFVEAWLYAKAARISDHHDEELEVVSWLIREWAKDMS